VAAERKVRIFEMAPRDGLQNEPRPVSFADKLWLVNGLVDAGVRDLELGAFVRPDRVPQMADTDRIFAAVARGRLRLGRARAWSLVPNRTGLARAVAAGVRRIAVFTAASETFNKRNIGMSVADSLREYAAVVAEARARGIEVRGYVSTAFGCPYEGRVAPGRAIRVVEKLHQLGVFQVSVGDTIGVATPAGVDAVIRPLLKDFKNGRIAVHFHDTRGTALANTLRALELGVRDVDSSAGGLGGCPFAPGATGNLATEDLVYMLHGMGMRTGIDLDRLCRVSHAFARRIKRPLSSRYLQAFVSARS
jgi:hydroxymethylglutaryl-CoA lyase